MQFQLPKDPFILLGVINMKLRDRHCSLEVLCEDLELDKESIIRDLRAAGFEYDEKSRQFR